MAEIPPFREGKQSDCPALSDLAPPDTGGFRVEARTHCVDSRSIDGARKMKVQLKGIGRNFNQLVVLSNMGKIKEVHLDETWQALAKVYLGLQELAEREVH